MYFHVPRPDPRNPPRLQRVVAQYGSNVKDRSSLRQIFASNGGYAGCATPVKEVSPGQVQPATESVRGCRRREGWD